MLREDILDRDPIMRMALAFYEFVRNNSDWHNRVTNAAMNRLKGVSDFDFEFDKKLYSFFYEYIDENNVHCCIKEYGAFYDTASIYEYLLFDYDLMENNITKIHKCGATANK